jgi:hypothetical protein
MKQLRSLLTLCVLSTISTWTVASNERPQCRPDGIAKTPNYLPSYLSMIHSWIDTQPKCSDALRRASNYQQLDIKYLTLDQSDSEFRENVGFSDVTIDLRDNQSWTDKSLNLNNTLQNESTNQDMNPIDSLPGFRTRSK